MGRFLEALVLTTLIGGCSTIKPVIKPPVFTRVNLETTRFDSKEALSYLIEFAKTSTTEDAFVYSVNTGRLYDVGRNEKEKAVGFIPREISDKIKKDLKQQSESKEPAVYWFAHNHPTDHKKICEDHLGFKKNYKLKKESAAKVEKVIKEFCNNSILIYGTLLSHERENNDISSFLYLERILDRLIVDDIEIIYLTTGKSGYSVYELEVVDMKDQKALERDYSTMMQNYWNFFSGKKQKFSRKEAFQDFNLRALKLEQRTAGRIRVEFYWNKD